MLIVVYSFVMLFRMVLMTVTILPTPVVQCDYNRFSPTETKSFGGCHDLNFSGHITTIILCVLFLTKKQGRNKPFWWSYAVISSIAVIAAREHYCHLRCLIGVDCLNSVLHNTHAVRV